MTESRPEVRSNKINTDFDSETERLIEPTVGSCLNSNVYEIFIWWPGQGAEGHEMTDNWGYKSGALTLNYQFS